MQPVLFTCRCADDLTGMYRDPQRGNKENRHDDLYARRSLLRGILIGMSAVALMAYQGRVAGKPIGREFAKRSLLAPIGPPGSSAFAPIPAAIQLAALQRLTWHRPDGSFV